MRITVLALFLAACGGHSSYSDQEPNTGSGPWGSTETEASIVLPDDGTAQPCEPGDGPTTLYVSPDDSNSMTSPVLAREDILTPGGAGWAPIREWEFFNYYTFGYPPAPPGELRITADLVAGTAPGEYVLQVGVSSEPIEAIQRQPLNLTFVIDTSGSMTGGPIDRVKEAGEVIAAGLLPGDVVSVVTWATDQNAVLEGHVVTGASDPVVVDVFRSLRTDGSTDLAAGLATGYRIADVQRDADRINRVVLMSDGGANVGVTDAEIIGDHASDQDGGGIYLVGIGTGSGSAAYHDALMDTVTDLGKGAAVYLGSEGEAERVLGDRLLEVLGVAARDVQIAYDLPAGFEIVRFSGEEVSTDPAEVEPQHIAPNDAMVLHQTLRTCAPEAVDDDSPLVVRVTWKDAITLEPREASLATTFGALLAQDAPLLRKGVALASYVEALRQDQALGDVRPAVEKALADVDAALADGPDPELDEMRTVLEAL